MDRKCMVGAQGVPSAASSNELSRRCGHSGAIEAQREISAPPAPEQSELSEQTAHAGRTRVGTVAGARVCHEVLYRLDRKTRRTLLQTEARARKNGMWPPWETLRFPPGTVGSGWTHDITTCHRNWVFSVLERDVGNGVTHYAVTSLSQTRPSWHEMQRIKDELAGEDRTAVEVYPPRSEIVDAADMFHFWVLPAALPFSLHHEVPERSHAQ